DGDDDPVGATERGLPSVALGCSDRLRFLGSGDSALLHEAPHGEDRDSCERDDAEDEDEDRKSTRLNSSHVSISYAVFCLNNKKKKSRTSIDLNVLILPFILVDPL